MFTDKLSGLAFEAIVNIRHLVPVWIFRAVAQTLDLQALA